MQKREKKCTTSVMHVQSCCFAYKTDCFLTFSLPSASLDLKVPNRKKLQLADATATSACSAANESILRLRSLVSGRIVDRLKHFTGHFLHTGPFNILALFIRN